MFNAGTHKVARSVILNRYAIFYFIFLSNVESFGIFYKLLFRIEDSKNTPGIPTRKERVAYRSYNTLFNVRDARKIDPRFKSVSIVYVLSFENTWFYTFPIDFFRRKEYWFQNGKHVLFHYVGDTELAKNVGLLYYKNIYLFLFFLRTS